MGERARPARGHRPAPAVAARRRRHAARGLPALLAHREHRPPPAAPAPPRRDPARGDRRRAAADVLRAAPAGRRGDRPPRRPRRGRGERGALRPARGRGPRHRPPVGRLPPGRDPGAAAVPDRRARLLLRRRGRAAAGREPRLLDRAAAVRGRLGPARAAVADAARARARGRGAGDGRARRQLRGDVRGGRGERPRRRGLPPGGGALGQLRQPRRARAGHELLLAGRQRRLRARAAAGDARRARLRAPGHAAGADPAVARRGAAGRRAGAAAGARARAGGAGERAQAVAGPRRVGPVRAALVGRRAALGRSSSACRRSSRSTSPSSWGRARRRATAR